MADTNPTQTENVNPNHYGGDACMRLMEDAGMGRHCCLSNITKYMFRLGEKDMGNPQWRNDLILQDAKKALWYWERYMSKDYGGALTDGEAIALSFSVTRGLANIIAARGDARVAEAGGVIDSILAGMESVGVTDD